MGIWVELGIFLLILLFALWQIHEVNVLQRKRKNKPESVIEPED
jgi:hypothetical protein